MGFEVGKFVSWTNSDGVRQRGRIKAIEEPEIPTDDEDKAMGDETAGPLLQVEYYKPKRDGWESNGKTVSIAASECSDIDEPPAPSRVPRKQIGNGEVDEASVKAIIDAAVQDALSGIKAAGDLPAELKIKRLGENKIGGYAVAFGNEKEHDIEGDWFTKSTDLWLDTYKNQPVFFDHAVGMKVPGDETEGDDNADPRFYKLGHITKVAPDDVGVWVEGVLDEHNNWVRGVMELVDKGALYFSSGSAPHLIKRTEAGEIKSWPIIEVSLTPTPAEPRKTIVRNTGINPAQIAKRESMDGSLRSINTTIKSGDVPVMTDAAYAVKSQLTTGENHMAYSNQKKLAGLLTALWTDELEGAVYEVKAAKRQVKEADPEELGDAADMAKAASSKLDEMVGPIVEQAKSVLGLDPDQVKGTLLKMAFAKVNADFPGDEEGSPEEEAAESPEEAASEGDMPLPEDQTDEEDAMMSADFLRFGPDEEPDDEYLDSSDSGKAYRSTDVERMVERAMKKVNKRQGAFQVKNFNINKGGLGESKHPLQDFINAAKRNTVKAEQASIKAAGAFKAMGINPETSGGYLVPVEQSNQVIELLRNKSLFMKPDGEQADGAGLITEVPLNRDTLTIPRETGAPTAYWIGENSTIQASDAAVGQIQLIAHKLACRVILANELLQDASVDVDNMIRKSMSKSMALEVDRAILYGTGIAGEPRGVYNSDLSYKTDLNGAPTYSTLQTLPATLELNNVELDESARWLLHPRDKWGFRNLQDGSGQFVFSQNALAAAIEGIPSQLFGYGWLASNTVARAGTAPNDETDIFFGKWSDVILGMRKTIEIVASDVAGTSFETDQTWIRAILRVDVALRHPESVAVYTGARPVVAA